MKKIVFCFLVFIIYAAPVLSQEAGNNIILQLKVNVQMANIREAPTTESRIITQVKLGTVLDIIGKEKNWYHVYIPQLSTDSPLKDISIRALLKL